MAPHSLPASPAPPKAKLRADLISRRRAVASVDRVTAAAALASHADALGRAAAGGVVSGFWPIGDEIDPRPLLLALGTLGVALALPRVEAQLLSFRRWTPGDTLVAARFGLQEPAPHAPEARPALMLVPLLGFDRAMNRIGYGRGFYDRALDHFRPRLAIGLAFACQEAPFVPTEAHDRALDAVLTERGRIDVAAAPRE